MSERYASFEAFWPFYLGEHSHPTNRRLHFVGTTLMLLQLTTAIVTLHPAWLLMCPVWGYGFAWIGHFIVEKNRPATFTYPLWSLMGDFKMYGLTLTGRLDAEIARCAG